MCYVPTDANRADPLTKPLPGAKYLQLFLMDSTQSEESDDESSDESDDDEAEVDLCTALGLLAFDATVLDTFSSSAASGLGAGAASCFGDYDVCKHAPSVLDDFVNTLEGNVQSGRLIESLCSDRVMVYVRARFCSFNAETLTHDQTQASYRNRCTLVPQATCRGGQTPLCCSQTGGLDRACVDFSLRVIVFSLIRASEPKWLPDGLQRTTEISIAKIVGILVRVRDVAQRPAQFKMQSSHKKVQLDRMLAQWAVVVETDASAFGSVMCVLKSAESPMRKVFHYVFMLIGEVVGERETRGYLSGAYKKERERSSSAGGNSHVARATEM
eukprot:gene244-biopygen119